LEQGKEQSHPASDIELTPSKNSRVSHHHHWFPCEMTYKKQGQKLHTDDATLPRSLLVEAHFQPIRTTTQIWVVMHHQYGISVLVSQTFCGETTGGGVTQCTLFSLAILPCFSGKTGAICHWRDLVYSTWCKGLSSFTMMLLNFFL